MGGTLTLETMLDAYDRVWDIPEEPYWFLCHPDDATGVRATVGADAPGKHTCPLVRVSRFATPGRASRISHRVDPQWPWGWRRAVAR
jgi:hypothetical protein